MGILSKLTGTETVEEKVNRLWESAKASSWSDEDRRKAVEIYTELLELVAEDSSAFNVCAIYRNRGISYRSLKNFDAALDDLAKELRLARNRDDQMRIMDCQRIIEETQEWKRRAEIESGGGDKAERMKILKELEMHLWGASSDADSAFNTLFETMEDQDPDLRAEASRLLSEAPKAVQRLIAIYEDSLNTNPHRAHLAGRVLGRKLAKGLDHMIDSQISRMMYGLNVAFIPCACVFCGRLNKGIPAPPRGPMIPYYHQDNDKGAYAVSVLCDSCGKKFFVVWDTDPR